MVRTTRVTMTMRELDRLKRIQGVVDQQLKLYQAAERLGLTTRQTRRLVKRYTQEGPVGLISRHRNRPSNNRLKAAIADQAFGIIRGLSGGGPAAAIDRSAGRPDCSHCRVRGDLRDGPRRELAKRFLIAERAAPTAHS